MPGVIRRSSLWSDPRVKPPFGSVQINWGHPLAKRLRGYWPLNEGGGPRVHDLAFNASLTPSAGTANWVVRPHGHALTFTSSDNLRGAGVWDTSYPVTIAAWIQIRAGLTGTRTIFESRRVDNTQGIALLADAFETVRYRVSGALATVQALGSTVLQVWRRYLVAGVSLSATDHRVFLNGVEDGSEIINPGTIGTQEQTNLGASSWQEDVYAIALWHSALAPSELRALSNEPYAFLQPVIRRRWFVPAAAGAAEFTAAARLAAVTAGVTGRIYV